MTNKVYVGGLNYDTTKDGLRDAFGACGDVSDVHIALDRETGQSRGFGFVTFTNEEEAQRAIDEMNGQSLDGRRLRVDFAQERGSRGGGDRRGRW